VCLPGRGRTGHDRLPDRGAAGARGRGRDELAAEYRDDGRSGARLDRPGLDALRDAAEAGLFEVVWCLSPDRLARSYAYQVLILDELARLGVAVRFADAPGLDPDDPQARLLTQVQGVIAEYERAKIGERYRRGKLFRSRAGEVISRKAPYGYRRVPRGPARLEIFEPEAAVARRIFAERAAGTTIRQICRQLNEDAVPTPSGSRAVWGTSTINRLLRNEAYIGRVYYNRTETVPDRRPGRRTRQVPRPATSGSPSPARPSSPRTRSRPPPRSVCDQLRQRQVEPAPRRTRRLAAPRPGQMRTLRRGHQLPQDARPQRHLAPLLLLPRPAARRRPGPPLPRAQHPRRRPRRVRPRPDPRRPARPRPAAGRRAGQRGPRPAPDDQLLAAELSRLDRRLESARGEHDRLVDLYQAGLIDMPGLHRRAAAITARQRELEHKRTSFAGQRAELARGNRLRHGVEHFAARVASVIDQLNPDQRQELLRLIIEDVQVTGWHVKIRLRIPLDNPQTTITRTAGRPHPGQPPPATARRQCQPKNVCVPFMVTADDSHRLAEALAGKGVIPLAT
jgi:site-specific DNA recombinase